MFLRWKRINRICPGRRLPFCLHRDLYQHKWYSHHLEASCLNMKIFCGLIKYVKCGGILKILNDGHRCVVGGRGLYCLYWTVPVPGIPSQAGHCKTLYTAAIQLSSSVLISDFKIDTKCQLEWKSVPTFTIFPTFSRHRPIRVDEHCASASVITIRQFVGNDQCYWCLITGKISCGRNNKQITWKQIKKKVLISN